MAQPDPAPYVVALILRLLFELARLACARCYRSVRPLLSRLWHALDDHRQLQHLVFSVITWAVRRPLTPSPPPHPPSDEPSAELVSQALCDGREGYGVRGSPFDGPGRVRGFSLNLAWLDKEDQGAKGIALQLNAGYAVHNRKPWEDVDWSESLNVRQLLQSRDPYATGLPQRNCMFVNADDPGC